LLPSAVTAIGEVQETIPSIGSEHVKLTVTFELFQPAGFGKGKIAEVIVGGTARLRS